MVLTPSEVLKTVLRLMSEVKMKHKWLVVPLEYKVNHNGMQGILACANCGRWEELAPKGETCESFRTVWGKQYSAGGMHDPFAGHRDASGMVIVSAAGRSGLRTTLERRSSTRRRIGTS